MCQLNTVGAKFAALTGVKAMTDVTGFGLLAHLTETMTLEPGDVVHFGTAVSPVKYSLRQANLHELGGPVAIEIDGLGRLESPVVRVP